MDLDGKVILVTGASSGIGAALAPQLAAGGATVGIVARRGDRLESVLAECRAHEADSELWAADLSDVDTAVGVATDAIGRFGGVAALGKKRPIGRRRLGGA